MPRRYMRCLLLIVLLCGAAPNHAGPVQEYELKTAFLYNFILFTLWPNESGPESSPYINVCTIGQDSFGPVLEQIQGRKIREKRLFLRREVSLDQIRDCLSLNQIYFMINECPFGKFSRPGAAGSGSNDTIDDLFEYDPAAMRVELNHVFTGITCRTWKIQ